MGITSLWRFWAAAGALWLTAKVVGGMELDPLAALILAVVLAAVGALLDAVWPLHGPGSGGFAGWFAASAVLFFAQWAVPFYHVSVVGAVVAGGLLWLLDQVFPVVFG